MDRVFANLTVKTIDEDQRLIEGWATTPSKDRVGDIVEPLGAEYDLPIPFLLDHDHTEAVGEVEMAEVSAQGIRFRARIRKIATPGRAKDLVDYAWDLLKHGLRKAVSIGFQPLEYEPLRDGGLRFTKWSWFELSAVSVPAQPDARVTNVKRANQGNVARVVKLTEADKIRGKILADADMRAASRARLGIAPSQVTLTPADIVAGKLAVLRSQRKKLSIRSTGAVVRLRR